MKVYEDDKIRLVVTPKSSNVKTGDFPQLWILPAKIRPLEATKTGQDSIVCGDCKHRHHNDGSCYVQVWQAPNKVWDACERGAYDDDKHIAKTLEIMAESKLRLGAWGDPAFIPKHILRELLDHVESWTGYTHQWHKGANLQDSCMASVDSIKEYETAKALGYRCFLVLPEDAEAPRDAIECPADSRGITCKQCGLCDGKRGEGDKRKNIWIRVHGARKGRFSSKLKVVQ